MKIPLQSRKRGCIIERLHLFAKDEEGYPFCQLAVVATRRKRVPFLYQFCCHSKRLARVLNFEDIAPIRATFTNTIANGINNSYPF